MTKTSDRVTPRERVLATASRLFYEHGIRAVGIDRIVAESGIGKMTLYRHFPSKDDLFVAVLEARNASALHVIAELAGTAGTAAERLVGLFERLEQAFSSPAWHGCAFANATLELHDSGHPARAVAARHKHQTADILEPLARAAGAEHPRDLAEQLTMLLDGAMVAVQVQADPAACRPAVQAARALVMVQTTR